MRIFLTAFLCTQKVDDAVRVSVDGSAEMLGEALCQVAAVAQIQEMKASIIRPLLTGLDPVITGLSPPYNCPSAGYHHMHSTHWHMGRKAR